MLLSIKNITFYFVFTKIYMHIPCELAAVPFCLILSPFSEHATEKRKFRQTETGFDVLVSVSSHVNTFLYCTRSIIGEMMANIDH